MKGVAIIFWNHLSNRGAVIFSFEGVGLLSLNGCAASVFLRY